MEKELDEVSRLNAKRLAGQRSNPKEICNN